LNTALFISKRYLVSRKRYNLINIISVISLAGIAVGAMALIIVLSVFNGFEGLVKSLFNSFNPDLQITAISGKTFLPDSAFRAGIEKLPGIISLTEVVEENALLKYKDRQYLATVKGVSNDYLKENPVDTMMLAGRFILREGQYDFAILGNLVAYHLGISLNDIANPIYVYAPRRGHIPALSLEGAFNFLPLIPAGVFAIQQDIDSRYILAPVGFVRDLMEYDREVTSLEIRMQPGADVSRVKAEVEKLAGGALRVKDRFEQEELLFRIMESEKLAIFIILSFILVLASFNVIGTLSMLVLDKRKDVAVLYSLGANGRMVEKIFLYQGLMISLGGALAGLFLGAGVCWLQQRFGLIRLGSESGSFIVDHYPVKMEAPDFLIVFVIVFVISFLASWYPVKFVAKRHLEKNISLYTKAQ